MAKVKTVFFCSSCGAESIKWEGQCRQCGEWNTLVEEKIAKTNPLEQETQQWRKESKRTGPMPVALPEIVAGDLPRLHSSDEELNRVLGGGIVPGSIVLFGGQPGIGKSTLLLQLALGLRGKVLYVSGEESEQQIKMRAERLGGNMEQCYILTETNTHKNTSPRFRLDAPPHHRRLYPNPLLSQRGKHAGYGESGA
ncbi:MAG: AAA family ATPase [Saprospiraceae bacterium]